MIFVTASLIAVGRRRDGGRDLEGLRQRGPGRAGGADRAHGDAAGDGRGARRSGARADGRKLQRRLVARAADLGPAVAVEVPVQALRAARHLRAQQRG